MASQKQSIFGNRTIIIGATVVSGLMAVFVPFLPAIISAVLAVKLHRSREVWVRNVVIANVIIIVANLVVTATAIGTGHMLRGIA